MKKRILVLSLLMLTVVAFGQNVEIKGKTINNISEVGGELVISNTDSEIIGHFERDSIYMASDKIKHVLNPGAGFFITNTATDGTSLKFWLKETGEVNWFLDQQDFFIRDSDFEAFGGVFTKYDFIHIDGFNGRIGFNVLSDPAYSDTNLPLTSSVSLFGSIATRVRTLDGSFNYDIRQDDHTLIINMAGNSVDLQLPLAADAAGRQLRIKRNGNTTGNGDDLTLIASGSDLIDGNSEFIISKSLGVAEIACDGRNWWVMSVSNDLATTNPVDFIITSGTTLTSLNELIQVNFTAVDHKFNINLPSAADFEGEQLQVKRNSNGVVFTGNIVRLKPAPGEFIDDIPNSSSYRMRNDFESVTIRSNGSRWLIISAYNN